MTEHRIRGHAQMIAHPGVFAVGDSGIPGQGRKSNLCYSRAEVKSADYQLRRLAQRASDVVSIQARVGVPSYAGATRLARRTRGTQFRRPIDTARWDRSGQAARPARRGGRPLAAAERAPLIDVEKVLTDHEPASAVCRLVWG